MKTKATCRLLAVPLSLVCPVALASACSSNDADGYGTNPGASASLAGSGGSSSSAGAATTGGANPTSAASTTSGSSTIDGGAATGSNSTAGGSPTTGGSIGTGMGGATGVGGNVATGGAPTTGGTLGTGGDSTTGGTSTGGTVGGGPTPGCGNADGAKGAQNLEMNVGGTARTYWLWVPDGYDPNSPIPLIFAWHGSGGDGDEVRTRYFHLEPAVGDGAIIIYPDGLPVNGGSTGWDLDAEGIDVQFFDALLESVSEDYCIDSGRVFSTGYSFGGMFTYTLACSRGSQLRGIAPTAGAFFGGGTCPTPVPAWIAHATNDDLVDYSSAQSARDAWLSTNGCGTTTTPTSPDPCVAYDCPADAPVHWCVHDEGHEWPSFAPEGIWAFFSGL